MVVVGRVHNMAALRDVPRRARLWVLRIAHIRSRLCMRADCVEHDKDSMDEDGQERDECMHDKHGRFDQQNEHGEDGDDHVETGDTRRKN